MNLFSAADIFLPDVEHPEKFAVIACDQFTSQPEYWDKVREAAGEVPSAVHLILPEDRLGEDNEEEIIQNIHQTM